MSVLVIKQASTTWLPAFAGIVANVKATAKNEASTRDNFLIAILLL
jgi:hypothetical protein